MRRLAFALGLSCVLASTARAGDEPDLRVTSEGAGLRVDVLPGSTLPVPSEWNLYRGALADVASSLQFGDPDGRCAVPGTDSAILLAGERTVSGDFYYLLTAVAAGTETGLGTWSDGTPRANLAPCPRPEPCGSEVLPVASIRGTEGIAIAPDGTIYYSQRAAIGRRLPGGMVENAWLPLPGATTVWGLALRDDGMLFAGSPTTSTIYRIDTTQAVPAAQVLLSGAGGPNGLTIDTDGVLLYSDFNAGRVYRVDDAGTRTQVTLSTIARANGLLVDDDGTLLVLAYSAAQVWRLTRDASGVEVSRALAGTLSGSLDGIAKDVAGRFYVGDNGGGRLLRTDSSFGNVEVLLTGVTAAANVAFGKGALDCTDVYVASSGSLALFEADVTGRP